MFIEFRQFYRKTDKLNFNVTNTKIPGYLNGSPGDLKFRETPDKNPHVGSPEYITYQGCEYCSGMGARA